ncbi:MAG: ATP-binding protein [Gammaproteobacteria bacterium]|nr:ATP-binding protein [Gammaproteobacteria bacterium]
MDTRSRQALSEQLVRSCHAPLPQFTRRRVAGRHHFPGKATAVLGARRAGKTTFLHQVRAERIAAGARQGRMPYISFEDERIADLDGAALGFLTEEYARVAPSGADASPVVWCFDEIQLFPGCERFVRRLLDEGESEVFVSGSSAQMLSLEVATSLRGRGWSVLMHPFGFDEALRHAGLTVPDPVGGTVVQERLALEREFRNWLMAGGFPEAQGLDMASRAQLLRDHVDVAILRDVVERHDVRNVAGLRWLVRHLLGNAGALFSVEKFHRALKSQGVAIARDTVHQLLGYLEDCFLVRVVWMETASERQRMVNPRKVYPVDTGLMPIFDRTGRANLGHALETAVLVELERRRMEVAYVKTADGYEVDFLARTPDGRPELIQVCADLGDPATARRELRALQSAGEEYPDAELHLITLYRDDVPPSLPQCVTCQPAWEWMLASR